MSPLSSPIEIQSLTALEHAGHSSAALRAGIVNIFRATAATWPSDDNDARAFQHLWLDQYLKHERDLVFVAHANGTIVGYLVGCQINPASSPRFQTLNYFQTFAPYCTAYPAHLHVNLDAAIRGQAVGARPRRHRGHHAQRQLLPKTRLPGDRTRPSRDFSRTFFRT
jgi:hypothetical protein